MLFIYVLESLESNWLTYNAHASAVVADPELQIRWGNDHPEPEKGGGMGGEVGLKILFGSSGHRLVCK